MLDHHRLINFEIILSGLSSSVSRSLLYLLLDEVEHGWVTFDTICQKFDLILIKPEFLSRGLAYTFGAFDDPLFEDVGYLVPRSYYEIVQVPI